MSLRLPLDSAWWATPLPNAKRKPWNFAVRPAQPCELFDFHNALVPYGIAREWQKLLVDQKLGQMERQEECRDSVIALQHSPVYTMGTGSSVEFLNFDLSNAPYEVHRTERGGEVTYHGPGQLVVYPILNLRNHKLDLHWYLRALEEVIIRALSSAFSIAASRAPGFTGVWVGEEKIAAIGVKVTRWITFHGLALNVTTDLAPFDHIVPCGIRRGRVGSVRRSLSSTSDGGGDRLDDQQLVDMAFVSVMQEFSEVFGLKLQSQGSRSIGMFEMY